MPVLMPSKGADFEPPPAGAHVAVCYRVADLGTQETTYKGQQKHSRLLLISWELPDEKMKDGRPFTVSRRYTYSSSAKGNLRKDLESWRGKKFEDTDFGTFDIANVIGAGCMLNIVHEDKGENTYANIASIMRLPKGTPTPPLTNPRVSFSLDDRPFDRKGFEALGERLQDVVMRSPEYKQAIDNRPVGDEPPPPRGEGDYGSDLDSDIPF